MPEKRLAHLFRSKNQKDELRETKKGSGTRRPDWTLTGFHPDWQFQFVQI